MKQAPRPANWNFFNVERSKPMDAQVKLVSKVLVLDSSAACRDSLKTFCDANGLVGLKVQDSHVMSVLKSNVDLGGIFLSEANAGGPRGGIALAREIHQIRPELPIFLRWEEANRWEQLSEKDRKLFNAAYLIDEVDSLRDVIDNCIFSLVYPNVLVRGIAELTRAALESQFKDMHIEVETPYLVRDRLIFGEIFTLIPLESSWCRGYMMLQAEEESLLGLVQAERTHIGVDDISDFRNLNNVLGEITNLIWGAFKNRYISYTDNNAHLSQVPIVINHLHRYISFGSEDAQLCFKYTLTDKVGAEGNEANEIAGDQSDEPALSLTIYQRFIFNLSWSPEDFEENQASVESLFDSGELELF
jgi:hypothetical protein